MSLADFVPEWQVVKYNGEEGFRVRGLSLADLSALVRSNLPDLETAFATYQDAQKAGASMDALVLKLISDAPVMAAHVIALGAGEIDSAEQAKQLPFPVQVDALIKTLNLTFVAVGGSKNFYAMLLKLLDGFGLTIPVALQVPLAKIQGTPAL